MASLFSVSRFIGKSRIRSANRTPSVKSTPPENETIQSQKHVVVDSASSIVIPANSSEDEASKANSRPETMPEQDSSFPAPPSRQNEVSKNHERKTEALEEPGYDVVLQPSAKVSFGEWTELDAGKKATKPTEKAFDAEPAQLDVDKNVKEELSTAEISNGTPVDTSENGKEPRRMPSVPDWTHLEIDKKAEESSAATSPPTDAEWLQLNISKPTKEEKDVASLSIEDSEGFISEAHVKERAAHLEEMCIVKEEREKLAERVRELETALQAAKHELQSKAEQISKFVIDLDRKEEEIKVLREEKECIKQAAARDKEESLEEARESNEAIVAIWQTAKELKEEEIKVLREEKECIKQAAARDKEESLEEARKYEAIVAIWQTAKELKDAETVELLGRQDEMQNKLDNMSRDLSVSQARVSGLKSANELQSKKLLEQDAALASHNDAIAALEGQNADLTAQVNALQINVKSNERQNSMLMVQLKKQSDNIVAWKGTISSSTKPVRRAAGPTLAEQAVRAMKALNDEIYQTAASLTDCVDEIEKRFVDESDGTAAALETLKSLLGTEIYTQLDKESCMMKDEYNPFILQTGFQACLTACCMRIITSWYPAEPEYGKFLEAIYERMRGLGGEENAARWRKYTLQSCTYSTDTRTKNILLDFVIDNLYAMLSMSGWPKLGETANLLDKFRGRISEVITLAVYLNILAAKTDMPEDLQATTIEEGKYFVLHEMTNDTPEEEGEEEKYCDAPYSQVVVGCVGLGLKWREGDGYETLKPRVIVRRVGDFVEG